VSLGVLRGSLLPSAWSAQAVRLLKFFPLFLLGVGGPPPRVMGLALRHFAGPLPLTLLTSAVRGPWLGLGSATGRSWQQQRWRWRSRLSPSAEQPCDAAE
jgi:ABC-2 type transport system permease protein